MVISHDLRSSFLAFRNECIWLQCCYNTYAALYEDGDETKKLIADSATLFFQDLNRILIEYCFLQISKISDPEQTLGRRNLTIGHLNSELRAAGLMTAEIEESSAGLLRYRSFIKDARNKLVSHLDRDAVLAGEDLGAHSPEELKHFFGNLYRYVDAFGMAIGEGPLDFRVSAGSGDIWDLMKLLRRVREIDATSTTRAPGVKAI